MNPIAEEKMLDSIAAWRAKRRRPRKLPPAIPILSMPPLHERWEEKYDRKYRQLKPREQFGKAFSSRSDWRKTA